MRQIKDRVNGMKPKRGFIQPVQSKSEKSKWISISFKNVWAAYGLFAAITGYSAYSFFKPKIEFEQQGTLDSRYALKTIMTVKNNSDYFNFKHLHPSLTVENVLLDSNNRITGIHFDYPDNVIENLKPDQSVAFTYDLSEFFKDKKERFSRIHYGELIFTVTYTFAGFDCNDKFYYITRLDNQGNAVWINAPELE